MTTSQTSKQKYAGMVQRLWQRDVSLWEGVKTDEPVHERMGWLDAVSFMEHNCTELTAWADALKGGQQFETLLLLGMGGSSLAPEVISSVFGRRPGYPRLLMVDTTSPEQISKVEIDPLSTLVIVASKSGTTLETADLFAYFLDHFSRKIPNPGDHFIAVTDDGSWLENQAREHEFRRIFINPSDIGGRYSALSYFGLVPAALLGIDLGVLLERVRRFADSTQSPQGEDEVLDLAILMGESVFQGKNKLVLDIDQPISKLSIWIEQLVAESTGKNGTGILPLTDAGPNSRYSGNDRVIARIVFGEHETNSVENPGFPGVNLRMGDRFDLGSEFLRWEMATALAAAIIKVNPFDQPDVELAKMKTRQNIESGKSLVLKTVLNTKGYSISSLSLATVEAGRKQGAATVIDDFAKAAAQSDYLAILAYLPVNEDNEARLEILRHRLSIRLNKAVTCGFGPRYLHSTGQFHKGGPPTGCFLQIMDVNPGELEIPGRDYGFGQLHRAQADGDFAVLEEKNLPIMRIELKGDRLGALESLADELG